MWSKVAPTSFAADLRVLMERGDVDQSSFAFTVARDEWKITGEGDDEKVERTILEVGQLYDVTTTAMGAYPQTDSQVAMRTREKARAIAEGLPEPLPAETPDVPAPEEDPADDGTDAPPDDDGAESEAVTPAQAELAARDGVDLWSLKRKARDRVARGRDLQEQLEKDMGWISQSR